MKKILLMIFILAGFNCYAQKEFADKINQTNSKGQKDGYWIENWSNGGKRELHYKNGVMHGNYKIYNSKGHLIWFGNYLNNETVGIWYSFGDYGQLESITNDYVKKDVTLVRRDNTYGTKTTFENQCYYISYHPNGTKESEGLLLWHEDPYEDTSYEYGIWKYYDESGRLIKTKEFK